VLLEDVKARALVVAGWPRQHGHEAWVLDGGIAAAARSGDIRRAGSIGLR
jgi:hypothetical protein